MATKKTRFYILDNGYMEMDQNWIVQNFFTWANANEKEKKAVWLRVPVYCVLIDHPDRGWILYDCGVDPRAMIDAWPAPNQLFFPYTHTEEQLLVNQLAKVGLKPEDITTVVVSHGHVDHVGNLPLSPMPMCTGARKISIIAWKLFIPCRALQLTVLSAQTLMYSASPLPISRKTLKLPVALRCFPARAILLVFWPCCLNSRMRAICSPMMLRIPLSTLGLLPFRLSRATIRSL